MSDVIRCRSRARLIVAVRPGAKESIDRWEMCIVTTQQYFRLAMGAIYSKNNVALKDTRNGVSCLAADKLLFPALHH